MRGFHVAGLWHDENRVVDVALGSLSLGISTLHAKPLVFGTIPVGLRHAEIGPYTTCLRFLPLGILDVVEVTRTCRADAVGLWNGEARAFFANFGLRIL